MLGVWESQVLALIEMLGGNGFHRERYTCPEELEFGRLKRRVWAVDDYIANDCARDVISCLQKFGNEGCNRQLEEQWRPGRFLAT